MKTAPTSPPASPSTRPESRPDEIIQPEDPAAWLEQALADASPDLTPQPAQPQTERELEPGPWKFKHVALDVWDVYYQPLLWEECYSFLSLTGREEDAAHVATMLNNSYYVPVDARNWSGGKEEK